MKEHESINVHFKVNFDTLFISNNLLYENTYITKLHFGGIINEWC